MTDFQNMSKEGVLNLARNRSTDRQILERIASQFFYRHELGIVSKLPITLDEILDESELSPNMLDVLANKLPKADGTGATDRALWKIVKHKSTAKATLITLASYSECADIRWEALMRMDKYAIPDEEMLGRLTKDPCFDIRVEVAKRLIASDKLDAMMRDSESGRTVKEPYKEYKLWVAISENSSASSETRKRAKKLVDEMCQQHMTFNPNSGRLW